RRPGVARGPVVGDGELAGGGKRDPERVAEAVGPDRVARAEGIVGRGGPVRVVPEDLAPDVRRVLRSRRIVLLPQGGVEPPVVAEGQAAALVAAVAARREGDQARGAGARAAAVLPPD